MFCTTCGSELDANAFYCGHCGVSLGRGPEPGPVVPLMRSTTDKRIAGVCGGCAKYFGMDPTIMRILWLVLAFGLPPAGLFGYLAAWILMPQEPLPYYSPAQAA